MAEETNPKRRWSLGRLRRASRSEKYARQTRKQVAEASSQTASLIRTVQQDLADGLRRLGAESGSAFGKMDYPGAEIWMRMNSSFSVLRLHSAGKEPWTVEWIETRMGEGDVLWDIGANVGAYSLIAAKAHEGRVQVLAAEPGAASFATLCENILANDVGGIVTPLPVALGAESSLQSFDYYDLDAGAPHSYPGVDPGEDPSPVFSQPVLTYALDDLVERFELAAPTHLKIDVDGAELAVVKGAAGVLKSDSLKTVMIEVAVSDADDVTAELLACGLSLETEYGRRPKAGVGLAPHWYCLFSRR